MDLNELRNHVAIVEDWPKKGIVFKDITPLMNDGEAYKFATDQIVEYAKKLKVDLIVGPEARGFIIGCPVAYACKLVSLLCVNQENCRVKRLKWNMHLSMVQTRLQCIKMQLSQGSVS